MPGLVAGLVAGLLLTALLPAPSALAAAPTSRSQAVGLPSWWYDAMRLGDAQKQSTGQGVTVAVIDDAIDPSAADIRGTHLTLATDCEGHRVRAGGAQVADHGTAMVTNLAGTGHGNAPGGLGVRGVAPDVKVLFYAMDTDPSTVFPDGCDSINGARLFRQAVRDGADIITTSLGFVATPQLQAAVRDAIRQGVVVVSATGDRTRAVVPGRLNYPAAEPGAVGVNAVDRHAKPWRDNPAPYLVGGHQEFPVVAAPGVDVDSSGYEAGRGWVSGGTRTGTSDAAPIVAGVLALVKSKYPDATGNQLVQQLIHYPSAGSYGWDRSYGFGIVSATKMLAHDPTRWPDVNPLLHGPKRAEQDFPMSVYGAQATPGAAATPSPSDDGATEPTAAAPSAHDGVPVWVWPAALVVLLGGLALVLTRRNRTTSSTRRPATTDDNAEDV